MKYKHTFVICAYKASPYLEECMISVLNQEFKSNVILITSTPCDFIINLCEKYNIKYFINGGRGGITQDWNFAYKTAHSHIVTIAHQDDIYFKNYTSNLMKFFNHAKSPLIFFSDYYEIRNNGIYKNSLLLFIKRIMLTPFRFITLRKSKRIRRMILSFGSPICCPSVAFVKPNLPLEIFNNHFRTNEDWEAWEKISNYEGEFLYCSKALMAHRIHEDSVTSSAIFESGRSDEDYEMFCKFWPECIAKGLTILYKKSESYNTIK